MLDRIADGPICSGGPISKQGFVAELDCLHAFASLAFVEIVALVRRDGWKPKHKHQKTSP